MRDETQKRIRLSLAIRALNVFVFLLCLQDVKQTLSARGNVQQERMAAELRNEIDWNS
jgi:hypothetical protein